MLDHVTSLRLVRSTVNVKTNNAKLFTLKNGLWIGLRHLGPPNVSLDVKKDLSGLKKCSESAPKAMWLRHKFGNMIITQFNNC